MKRRRIRGKSEMQFFRSALFPATGEPPVLVSATFKFVALSALFAEKCLFNFVYRHCKIFTRSLLLEQFSHHHRGRWELDDARIRRREWEVKLVSSRYVRDCIFLELTGLNYIVQISKVVARAKNLHFRID